jgi:hypothetical protein
MVRVKGWLAKRRAASDTLAVKLQTPGVVAVPEMTPFEASASSGGSEPEVTCHWYGAWPPVAASVCEQAAPAVPEGRGEAVAMASGVRVIVSENAKLAVSDLASATVAVKAEAPAAVGVPAITPPEESVRPAGNAPDVTAQEYGGVPQQADRVCEYAAPVAPDGNEDVVMASWVGRIVSANCCWALEGHGEPVTATTKLAVPAAVGVPEISPPLERVRPGGSDPDARLHVTPPVAVSACE